MANDGDSTSWMENFQIEILKLQLELSKNNEIEFIKSQMKDLELYEKDRELM